MNNKWIVKHNGVEKTFDWFSDATLYFRSSINEYFESNKDVFAHDSYIPSQLGVYFFYKYDEGIITDQEIAIESRISKQLDSFKFLYDNSGNFARKVLINNIDYEGTIDEFYETLMIKAIKTDNEIQLEINDDDGDKTFLLTNAFILDDKSKMYYFNSHQIINCVSEENREDLGKSVDLYITLEMV